MKTASVEISTVVMAPADVVWAHATSPDGINRELAPWLAMTVPPEAEGFSLADAVAALGEPLFESRVLLFGRVPVETMRITLVELEPGRRFVEQSPMRTLAHWRHEREIEATGSGTRVTDRVAFAAPIGVFTPALRPVVAAFFRHRHRRLAALFGS
jgi:ligand-binding SRPBCC domain-containing protein